jgi:hypothetical protein
MQQGQTAREQFEAEIVGNPLCAMIEVIHQGGDRKSVSLNSNYTKEEYQNFLASLEFERGDVLNGFNYVSGIVWISETEWYERNQSVHGDYWAHFSVPPIPQFLTI